MTHTEASSPSPLARALGFGGLIPFVGLAMAIWLAPPDAKPLALAALLGYGAAIASFLGAIHWGLAMRGHAADLGDKNVGDVAVTSQANSSAPALLWGVVPSLVGWLAFLVGQAPGLLLIAALLWTCFAVDRVRYRQYALQAWLPMRLQLTVVASLSCVVGAAALLR